MTEERRMHPTGKWDIYSQTRTKEDDLDFMFFLARPDGTVTDVSAPDHGPIEEIADAFNKRDELGDYAMRKCPDCEMTISHDGTGHAAEGFGCNRSGDFEITWPVAEPATI